MEAVSVSLDDRLREAERVVLKFGTNSLTVNGRLDYGVIRRIAAASDRLYIRGQKPVIVTSGAVAAGMEFMHIAERPASAEDLQYLSAKGVLPLSTAYAGAFGSYGIYSIYVPVTWRSFASKAERESIRAMVMRSWAERDITIWNCNDALTSQELVERPKSAHSFYDNDPLSAKLAICVNADALVFFTDHGNMGTGGRAAKSRAMMMAAKKGIYVAVYSINQLEDVMGLQ